MKSAEDRAIEHLLHAVEFAEPAWFGKHWALRMADRVLRDWTARRVPLACWWALERLKRHPSVPTDSARAELLDGIFDFLADDKNDVPRIVQGATSVRRTRAPDHTYEDIEFGLAQSRGV